MKPDLDVAQAKAADLLDVARGHGAQLKKSGGEWIGRCPACGGSDRFSINIKNRVWNCRGFGGGDVINLEMHLAGSTFVEAVRALVGEGQGNSSSRWPTPDEIAERKPRGERRLEEAAAEVARNARRAAEIVARLQPVIGRPGEDYLRDVRRIDVNHWATRRALEDIESLGWSERTYFHQADSNEPFHELHGQWLSAIVAVLTDAVTGERTGGITRTFVSLFYFFSRHWRLRDSRTHSLRGVGMSRDAKCAPTKFCHVT